jgi:hypothetical protein
MTTQWQAERAVISVGEGRGCVVKGRWDYFVVMAAHCLPFVPRCDAAASSNERTYLNLLGPLGQAPTLWAECVFIDPIEEAGKRTRWDLKSKGGHLRRHPLNLYLKLAVSVVLALGMVNV